MDGFADRLRALIGEGSANAFARECSIGESSLRQYLAGGIPGLDKVIQIARAKNVHVEWLATGEGPRDIRGAEALASESSQDDRMSRLTLGPDDDAQAQDMVMLPQLAVKASAGPGLVPLSEHIERYVALREEYLREIGVSPQHAHVLRVSGRSMAPTISDRDIVVVDTSVNMPVNEGLYTVVYGDTVLIKRVRLQRDGGVMLVSDNKSEGYADELIPRSDLESLIIVGRVKGHIRSL